MAARWSRWDLSFDAILVVAFTLVYSIGFTGQSIHEWLGVGIGLALVGHLTRHWDWVARVTRNLVTRRGRARLPWLINMALLVAMTLCVMSGIYISMIVLPEFGVSLGSPAAFGFWRRLHSLTANATLILVPIHVAMDWRWILGVARRLRDRSSAGITA
jgi:predicted ABC-type sugar transport system permease subunit